MFPRTALDKQDILLKDAIYTAIGLAGCVLSPVVNFQPFLNNTLVEEVQISYVPWYNIVRRRIAILIGQWVTINIPVESRQTVYKITQHLLNKSDPLNDLVVRLTAARELQKSIDDWDFKKEDFLPYATSLLESLLGLIEEVETTEAQVSILGVIGCVVHRLERRIEPYAERIVNTIPPLWGKTGEQHLFKQSILVVLTQLVTALNASSVRFHDLMLPLIRYSIDPAQGMQIHLLDDALELWEATLKSTPAPAPPQALDLIPLLFPLFELGGANLRKVLEIAEAYVLLAPTELINRYLRPTLVAFTTLIQGHVKREIHIIVTSIIEIILRVSAADPLVLRETVKELLDTGFLILSCDQIYQAWAAEQTTGPKKVYAPVDSSILTNYFNILARIVLASTEVFVDAVRYIGRLRAEGDTLETTMRWLLDEWFSHVSVLFFLIW